MNDITKKRIIFFACIVFILFVVLFCRLYYLQIIHYKEYNTKAINNRIKIIRTAAPRGPILDRNGKSIADNYKSYVINVIPEELEKNPQSMQLLCKILGINAKIYYDIIEQNKTKAGYPVRIASNVSLETLGKIGEYRHTLKGVSIENIFIRSYPIKNKACHITGYTREISKEKLDETKEKGLGYKMGDYIGVAGLEKEYESYLKGIDGGKRVEVNSKGEVVKILKDQPHIPGKTLMTSIDRDLQEVGFEMLQGKVGATVAMDPNNGEILAMVSNPSFNPNVFSDGLKLKDWRKITSNRNHPLQNRFIGSFYPPGSVFKPIIGVSVLDNNVANTGSLTSCPGFFKLGNYRKGCWAAHGTVDFYKAIAMSCDVWFYKESLNLGIDRLYKTASDFGLGKPTGIDLPEEIIHNGKSGNFPSREWHEKVHKSSWKKGDMLNVSIGQGDVQVSPMQMCLAISAIANGGYVYTPHIMREIVDTQTGKTIKYETKVKNKVEAREETFRQVRGAMEYCVKSGTGKGAAIEGVRVGGKTGSAQATGGVAHGWFVAFAPVDNPQIVVATIVEHGGSGSGSAAPICKAMIKKYLRK